jgi:hypothetical protein
MVIPVLMLRRACRRLASSRTETPQYACSSSRAIRSGAAICPQHLRANRASPRARPLTHHHRSPPVMSGPLRDRVFVSGVSLGKASSKNEPRKIRVAAGGPVADLILAAYRDGQTFPITLSGDVLAMRSPMAAIPWLRPTMSARSGNWTLSSSTRYSRRQGLHRLWVAAPQRWKHAL